MLHTHECNDTWPKPHDLHLFLQVQKGDLVYDPFVGTGSILVAAAHLGAHTIGADIDIRVVRDGEQLHSIQPLLG